MISITFVILFAICRPASMTSTIGTLGRLLFRVVAHSHFLPRVLLSTHGLLLFFLRHQLPQKTLISRRVDPFCWWQKGGELFDGVIVGVSFYAFMLLCCIFCIWICSLFYGHMLCVFVCIWFLRLAWTSKHVWTYLFLIWQLFLLSLCGICVFFLISYWSNHLPLILEAGGIFG